MLGSHSSSSAVPIQILYPSSEGVRVYQGTEPEKKNISKYLSVGTDDNSRAEAKGAGSFVGEDNTLIVFPTQRATHNTRMGYLGLIEDE